MTEMDSRKKLTQRILFSFAVALVTILVFSCCSPLYPFNYWEDPNCFFTVGLGILKGQVPYRDLYEQKGPLLYFIHALAALISRNSFLGVFFIQIVICTVTHFFWIKIAELYTKVTIRLYILSVPALMLLYSVNSYFYGDSAEEMILPFYVITLYIILKAIKTKKMPGKGETAFIAIGSACAFWIKYTLCGYFLGTVLIFLVFAIREKKFKELLKLIGVYIATFVLASLPVLAYFAANHAVGDMFTAYFYNNIFLYRNVSDPIPLSGVLPYSLIITVIKLGVNPYLAVMLILSIVFFVVKRLFAELLAYMTLFLCTIVFIFQGSFIGFYYIFALAALAFPALAGVECLLAKIKVKEFIVAPVAAGLVVLAFFASLATDNIFRKKEELPQYVFAEYTKDYPDATMLNYDFLDQGFYTVCGIKPTVKYFCLLNIDTVYNEARLSKELAIANQKVDFVVTKNHTYEWEGYKLVKACEYTAMDFNAYNGTDAFYLYKRTDLK